MCMVRLCEYLQNCPHSLYGKCSFHIIATVTSYGYHGYMYILLHTHIIYIHINSHPSPVVTITDNINRSEVILSELIVKLSNS